MVNHEALYDFLYQHDYQAWFCNASKKTYETFGTRKLKEFILRLHTGETQADATTNWTWEQRQQLGQRYLHNLAEDILNEWAISPDIYTSHGATEEVNDLLKNLELDGYVYRSNRLLAPESDVLDTKEEAGVLETLYSSLRLGNQDVASHHLAQSEQRYLAGNWDDSISNSRKFIECALREAAAAYSLRVKNVELPESTFTSPANVRDYLEREGLLETKEKKAIAAIYALLSETGAHPYMADNDQARLLRHLALTLSHFVLLRLQGVLQQGGRS